MAILQDPKTGAVTIIATLIVIASSNLKLHEASAQTAGHEGTRETGRLPMAAIADFIGSDPVITQEFNSQIGSIRDPGLNPGESLSTLVSKADTFEFDPNATYTISTEEYLKQPSLSPRQIEALRIITTSLISHHNEVLDDLNKGEASSHLWKVVKDVPAFQAKLESISAFARQNPESRIAHNMLDIQEQVRRGQSGLDLLFDHWQSPASASLPKQGVDLSSNQPFFKRNFGYLKMPREGFLLSGKTRLPGIHLREPMPVVSADPVEKTRQEAFNIARQVLATAMEIGPAAFPGFVDPPLPQELARSAPVLLSIDHEMLERRTNGEDQEDLTDEDNEFDSMDTYLDTMKEMASKMMETIIDHGGNLPVSLAQEVLTQLITPGPERIPSYYLDSIDKPWLAPVELALREAIDIAGQRYLIETLARVRWLYQTFFPAIYKEIPLFMSSEYDLRPGNISRRAGGPHPSFHGPSSPNWPNPFYAGEYQDAAEIWVRHTIPPGPVTSENADNLLEIRQGTTNWRIRRRNEALLAAADAYAIELFLSLDPEFGPQSGVTGAGEFEPVVAGFTIFMEHMLIDKMIEAAAELGLDDQDLNDLRTWKNLRDSFSLDLYRPQRQQVSDATRDYVQSFRQSYEKDGESGVLQTLHTLSERLKLFRRLSQQRPQKD